MSESRSSSSSCGSGLGIGSVIAAILSWTSWHSIPWTILHCLFGWGYVVYWAIYYWE